ncbi:MAG: YeeE/YedE family protein, partial [Myxococcales bacterium]|nr:YeeE/YedE family protein [Myxococcales bacterium]
ALVLGALFGLGLTLSGMTRPEVVKAFLDVTGDWDPSLAFVMGGAVVTFALIFRLAHRRAAPRLGGRFPRLPRRADPELFVGAALFGLGWGLAGICPGPALVDLGAGIGDVAVFTGAMLAGVVLHRLAGLGASGAREVTPSDEPVRADVIPGKPA